MDDPLRTEFNSGYAPDTLDTDFEKRLGFAAASSLRYFDSGPKEDRGFSVSLCTDILLTYWVRDSGCLWRICSGRDLATSR